jgi:hypothetical protein
MPDSIVFGQHPSDYPPETPADADLDEHPEKVTIEDQAS